MAAASVFIAPLGFAPSLRPLHTRAPPRHDARARLVLLITIDTLRADAVGAYEPRAPRRSHRGVVFRQAHNVVTLPRTPTSCPAPPLPARRARQRGSVPSHPHAGHSSGAGYRTDAFQRVTLDSPSASIAASTCTTTSRSGRPCLERHGGHRGRGQRWLARGDGPTLCWIHLYDPHPYLPREPFASFTGTPYGGSPRTRPEPVLRLLRGGLPTPSSS